MPTGTTDDRTDDCSMGRMTARALLSGGEWRASTGVDIFFSLIFSYFCFLVAAFRPCHGRLPRRKYIST